MIDFTPWPKIPRDNPFNVTITEKIDGTNACIVIQDNKIVGIQSRKRFITPENDNFNFALWVWNNAEDLLSLGDGHHFGEWAGPGIQKNPHNLEEKTFFLFNTRRWNDGNPNRPDCCSVVPTLYEGILEKNTIPSLLLRLEFPENKDVTHEGVVVFYHAFQKYTKHTIKSPNGKWCK